MDNLTWSQLVGSAKYAIVSTGNGPVAVTKLAAFTGIQPALVGQIVTEIGQPNAESVQKALANRPVLTDLDVLFWPPLRLDILRFLNDLARKGPLLVNWPGSVDGETLRYSTHGRPDYFAAGLPDSAMFLRPTRTTFHDEAHFVIERI